MVRVGTASDTPFAPSPSRRGLGKGSRTVWRRQSHHPRILSRRARAAAQTRHLTTVMHIQDELYARQKRRIIVLWLEVAICQRPSCTC
jgi:hypothetical protein